MCVSCGCGDVNDNHGDSRNITLGSLDAAAQAAGTTRGRVIQNISQLGETISSAPAQSAQAGRGDYYGTARESMPTGARAGEISSEPGEIGDVSGPGWQERQQTESGGEVNL